MIDGIGAIASIPAAGQKNDPNKVKDAASQFEALLITQMLKSARESSGSGWTGKSEDNSSESVMEMSEQHLAQVLASQGGLGLAKMIVDGLNQQSGALKEGDAGNAKSAGVDAKGGVR